MNDHLQTTEAEETIPLPLRDIGALNSALLAFDGMLNRRLPWRENRTPYRVWVSEIMLQQTRAETVIRYYDRFLAELPDVAALAAVKPDRLSKLWQGLGYYRRVSLMHRAAMDICSIHGGKIPGDYVQLRALPGFGDYTAGAVASFAFGLHVPAVDGNLLRVLARLCTDGGNVLAPVTATRLREFAWRMLPMPEAARYAPDGGAAGAWNQAMMDLGATVCLPNTRPRCEVCPLSPYCRACAEGSAERLPVRVSGTNRKTVDRTVFRILTEPDGGQGVPCLLLRKRAETGLLAGLYELPGEDMTLEEDTARKYLERLGISSDRILSITPLPPAKHMFTHITWRMTGYEVKIADGALPSGLIAVTPAALLADYSVPSAFSAYLPHEITDDRTKGNHRK